MKLGVTIVFAASVCLAGSQNNGASISVFRLKDRSALALFSSTDASGCLLTAVNVQLADEVETIRGNLPHSNTSTRTIVISMSQINICDSTTRAFGEGVGEVESVQFGPNLSSAHVTASIKLIDPQYGIPFNADIDLDFIATGPVTRTHDTDIDHVVPGMTVITHSNGISRDAVCSGTVHMYNHLLFGDLGNTTPGDSLVSSIQNNKAGTVTIIHN